MITWVKQDTLPRHFVLILNAGISSPFIDYKSLSSSYYYQEYSKVSGFALPGGHFDLTGIYIPQTHFGFAAKTGMDINPPHDQVYEYMAGFYAATKPRDSFFNTYFLLMFGAVSCNINNPGNSFFEDGSPIGYTSGSEIPGMGNGVAFLAEMGFTIKSNKWFSIDFSLSFLYSEVHFPHGVVNTFSYYYLPPPTGSSSSSISNYAMYMDMGILQACLGFRYFIR